MKKEKKSAILFYVASLLFYVVAFISHFVSSETSMTVIWICLGSCFLCLGAVQKKKDDDKNDDVKNDDD